MSDVLEQMAIGYRWVLTTLVRNLIDLYFSGAFMIHSMTLGNTLGCKFAVSAVVAEPSLLPPLEMTGRYE